jgi:hypothetical protein
MIKIFEKYLGDGSYGIVYLDANVFSVFEIPLYGGDERFYKDCSTLEEAIEIICSELT